MADIDPTPLRQIFKIPKGLQEANTQHHRQANDLWAGFEVAKWGAFCPLDMLQNRPARLKLILSDKTIKIAKNFQSTLMEMGQAWTK